ncbi:hypothetical protein C1646_819484 [Rhizophagus diaphanus]|nr:hypothetical protein C1646_819484 [Rhizophagus diaphanus] [Rhizophagus sp. MUCL 43196]
MNKISHIVLCGRTGDGKSSIANMLVQGDIYRDKENLFNIGNAAIGETRELTYARDVRFGVFDLVGLGELPSGGVPHDVAIKNIRNHFSTNGLSLHYICYVKRSRITKEDIRLFGIFKKIFKEGEKNFVIIVTHTGPSWTDDEKNVDETQRNFGDYPVISVDFPKLNYSGNNPEVLSSSQVIENSLSNIINAVPVAGSLYQLTASGVYLMSGKPNVAKKRFMNGAFGIFLDVVSFGAEDPENPEKSISNIGGHTLQKMYYRPEEVED